MSPLQLQPAHNRSHRARAGEFTAFPFLPRNFFPASRVQEAEAFSLQQSSIKGWANTEEEESLIVKKFLPTMLLAAALLPAATSFAQVVVRVGPPAPIVETRPVAPGPGFVWIAGYHRWDGGRYVWVPGRWDRPPIRMPVGFRIAGSIAAAAGSSLKATGDNLSIRNMSGLQSSPLIRLRRS